MTRDQIHASFDHLFADSTKTQAVTHEEIALVEAELGTTFPESYLTFITKFGAFYTPSILDLVTGGESEISPEGASWDIMQFFKGTELVEVARGYWSAGMKTGLVPVASDSMGNVFGFRRGLLSSRPDDLPVLFFDHDFIEFHEEAVSFDLWLNSFINLKRKFDGIEGERAS